MQITIPNDADLLARLKNFEEDHFVERKTSGDSKKDWLKTAVAFANSGPTGFPCVLYLGVKDNGEIESKPVNLDTLQKTFAEVMKDAYPPIAYLTRIITDGERAAWAVIVFGSELRPHFAGPAYVRNGSKSIDASEEQFAELIAQRNSKAGRILQYKGKPVTVFVRSEEKEVPWPKSTTLVDCDQFYVTIQAVVHEPASSFPLSRVEINFDNLRKTLQLEITDPSRNAWEVELELSARMVLGNMMTHGGRILLGWLLKQERIECQVQFMPEFSLNTQNEQMEIAVKQGLVRRSYERSGGVQPLCFYVFNSEYLPVLKRVLPEFLGSR
ncbi:MAG TPA: ATP-binding protein [Candidatus Acidoferrales bacterium]|nr:ATP-binding protein [Candidatus Acidoferrales bacterium]